MTDHSLQFLGGSPSAFRVDGIAVTAQADVLNYMQARQARYRSVAKRQTIDIGCDAVQAALLHNQRPIVDEYGRHMRREHPDHQHARPNVDMLSRLSLRQPPRKPVSLIEVMWIERSGRQPIRKAGVTVGDSDRPRSSLPTKREPIGHIARQIPQRGEATPVHDRADPPFCKLHHYRPINVRVDLMRRANRPRRADR